MLQHPTVEKLFYEQANYYSQTDQSAKYSSLVSFFLNWSKSKTNHAKIIKICEFGGAGGILLDSINKSTKLKIKLYNAEIVEKYRDYQINPKIQFHKDSILHSRFPDNFFDCVIIRDVLHHLIGKDYRATINNQKKALTELKRITKPQGIILIEELVGQSALAVKIIYFLSKLNSKIGLRSRRFQITPNTIILMLTSEKLAKLVGLIFGSKNIIKKIYVPSVRNWRIKMVHLWCNSGKFILMIKKT